MFRAENQFMSPLLKGGGNGVNYCISFTFLQLLTVTEIKATLESHRNVSNLVWFTRDKISLIQTIRMWI